MQKVETQSWTLKARGWRAKESERRNETKDMRGGVNKTDIINYVRSWIFQCDTKLRGLIYHVTFFLTFLCLCTFIHKKRNENWSIKTGRQIVPTKNIVCYLIEVFFVNCALLNARYLLKERELWLILCVMEFLFLALSWYNKIAVFLSFLGLFRWKLVWSIKFSQPKNFHAVQRFVSGFHCITSEILLMFTTVTNRELSQRT